MNRLKLQTLCLLTFVAAFPAFSQRGLPPKEKTATVTHTKFPMHLDFLPDMVKLLKVTDGWEVKVAASILGRPRMLHPGPNGSLYVTRRDAADVLLLKDKDGDHRFDDAITVVYDFKSVHGITTKDNYLYLCSNRELRRYPMNTDGTVGAAEVLIKDMPSGGQHPNRTIAFEPDGILYITVGTECNDCKEDDIELASILQIDPKTWMRKLYASHRV
jgi:glucose/arabinose dehydrogenase